MDGRFGRRWRYCSWRRDHRILGGGAGQSAAARASISKPASRSRAATWKAKKCASASPTPHLFATVTTDASCGAINGWHDSFTPLGGMVPLVNIMLGEVIFGGVGAGMYGMLIYIVLAVFIAGLMVGRTPEYLGKKIEAYDVKMAMLVAAGFPAGHPYAAPRFRSVHGFGTSSICNPGPHGLSADSICLHFDGGEQRFGVRWIEWQHAVVQHQRRLHHAGRTLPDDHSHAGHRRKSGTEEICAAFARHVSGHHAVVQRRC